MKIRKKLIACHIALLIFAIGGIHGLHAKVLNRVIAVVNDEPITEAQLDEALSAQKKGRSSDLNKAERRKAIDRLINQKLLDQLLDDSKIEVSEDDLARAIQNVLQQNRMTIGQLKSEIASKGLSYEAYKKEIARQIKRIKFINQVIGPQVKISDQDLRDYYQHNQELFRGSVKAHIAQIFLPFEGITTEEEAEQLKDTSLSIVQKARAGTSFSRLVKQYSKGPNAQSGGDLGMVNLKDLPQNVADTVRNMRVGDVSYPILVEKGLIIVKLIALPELSSTDFDRLRDQIYASLYDARIEETLDAYLQRARQKAFIEVR